MSPIKLEQQHDTNSKENELEEPLALGSTSNHTKKIYYDLELRPKSNLSNIDDFNHSRQSFFTALAGQYKLVLTCAAFSTLFLSAGFLVNQILRASIFLPTRVNNSNASGLIEIINNWETDILSPQYLWLSAQNLQQDGYLQRPIHLLKIIPENSELYTDAQAEIIALQDKIWEMAKARYEAGEQDEAIMIAESIQPDSPHYGEVQTAITSWEQAWQTDKPKAEQILALAESTKWGDWMTVRSLYNELTNPYWKNELESIYREIETKIQAEQKRLRTSNQKRTITPAYRPSSGGNSGLSGGSSSSSSSPNRVTSPRGGSSAGSTNGWSEDSWGDSAPSTRTPSNSDPITGSGRPETEPGGNRVWGGVIK